MYKTLVTFATEDFEQRRNFTINSMIHKFDNIVSFRKEDIDKDFYDNNNKILDLQKGAGYWLWKPHLLLKYLNNSTIDNEMIVYCDSGDYIEDQSLDKAENILKENDIFLIKSPFSHTQWTKRDCFVLTDCDNEFYWNANHIYSATSYWKNNAYSKKFIKEWLDFCSDENILTDLDNISGKNNFNDFIEHRYDQSVLTNMALKYNVKTEMEIASNPWKF